ncbi:GTPase [Roseofilum capinflatum]|uniref:50S ribosome-binding GTPase n=1 Tax=Roseofilum capinflatum BLCC-M114 TaxID=3022440 RepID=A0ABT7B237_9CYAN|nr:GTPase [Roseofilum capinflatum]MDJ1173232.1 50S ribosome-binding GTPase [Roseofilum capinflatum BLCC-M114]
MSSNSLQKLRVLFYDRPEVLKMLDFRELDLSSLEEAAYLQEQKNRKLYPEPVNFYATGRTGAGKTSLGNALLDPGSGKPPMESHGHQDCTSSIQYFKLQSNLRYFDLPGAGSSEEYENINRASLLVEQLDDEDDEMYPVDEFKVLDFSEYETQGVQEEVITVEQWQSSGNQQFVAADIILYVVAPHMLFTRDDQKYLKQLLKSQKQRSQNPIVIFALNIHRTKEGQIKPTSENLEDARKLITQIYQKFYPNISPPIVEIDSRTGAGINQITEIICQILPSEKIGNMQQALKKELKEYAKKERSYRYREALLHIASRLATVVVDQKLGDQGLINEAYMAVTDYAIRVFREEQAVLEAQQEFDDAINQFAESAKVSRQEAETILVEHQWVQMRDQEVEKTDYVPDIQDVDVQQQIVDYVDSQESRKELVDGGRSPGRIAGGAAVGGLAGLGGFVLGLTGVLATGATVATGGLAAPLAAAVLGGAVTGGVRGTKKRKKEVTVTEDVIKPVVKTITVTEKRLVGMKEVKKTVTEKVPEVMREQREQATGNIKYLQGGYPVVENLLAIGLGIEKADSSVDLKADFASVVNKGRQEVQGILQPYLEQINDFAVNSDRKYAEEKIMGILQAVFLN